MSAVQVALLLSLVSLFSLPVNGDYKIGVGRYDITGPAAEIEMMGMANPSQIANGIHFRQYSRAFIVVNASNDTNRVVFVSIDACMGTQIMKNKVVEKLQSNKTFAGLYTDDNVCISGTHTHSGPAGYFQYLLYEITSRGFSQETLDAIVDGIVESIAEAHQNIVPGKLLYNTGVLLNASRNRSPTAYLLNPEADKALYQYDTDKDMVVIKFVDNNGTDLGMINWFAVHGTSMNNTNTYISGDNKGYASLLHEKDMDKDSLPGQSKFIAAYAQSNEGDVTPNLMPQHCPGHPEVPCDANSSKCLVKGKELFCIAFGPGVDMFDSTRIIGERQFDKGKELYDAAFKELSGPVQYLKVNRDFSNIELEFNGKKVHTCTPAMGDSFAAGTIDGPGAFSFKQNDTTGNKFWDLVGHLLHEPSKEEKECQAPKPILLDTGDINILYPWAPRIVPLQMFRIGQLVISAVPAEFTTMSGRYLKNAVKKIFNATGDSDIIPVIAGLSNTYSDYVTTYYEYQQQRYEAGSTIFGPYTLNAYVQEFSKLAVALATDNATGVDKGPPTPDYYSKQKSLILPVLTDKQPKGKKIGDVKVDVKESYAINDTVEVVFWAGNPRNDRKTNSTFLTVEIEDNDQWTVMYTDASLETRFKWEYDHSDTLCIMDEIFDGGCTSHVTIQWFIPPDTVPGTYRIQHFGAYKNDGVHQYQGVSGTFKVTKM
ncbi:PREDICTED: neutral ceramidase B-like isoform X3 [Amphimedon queenslandica]|uniref:Neutral ceramidase n=1 Tax=Amphimedon queenslandica TaxID=400682 RepID=A0AAN0JMV1_AMPQE|nr:PREDICTED: neutral ceramidase B-like isoform X3 [Amphimedon queenslandica]|eukprot:XP_019858109.1 PREDICTED: neutral ceramidase B-like isoform X3 [Amphimedon queenslandica]